MSERVRGVREDALYKSTLLLHLHLHSDESVVKNPERNVVITRIAYLSVLTKYFNVYFFVGGPPSWEILHV